MRSINKVILIGNVGRDPEVQTTRGGKKLARLSLATSRRVGKNGDGEDRTEWHRVTVWDKLAEIAEQYIRKGDRLYIEGRIEYGSYEREDGTTAYTTDIVAHELILLGTPGVSRDAEDDELKGPDDRELRAPYGTAPKPRRPKSGGEIRRASYRVDPRPKRDT